MRSTVTWLLVGAVAALGLAAAVDALRGGEERALPSGAWTPTVPGLADQPALAIRQLREAGVGGVLTYSDEECRLHAVSLPELEPVYAPSYEMCRPLTGSGGLGAVDGEVVWAGLGYGTVQVVLSQEELSRALRVSLGIPEEAEAGFLAVQAVALDEERYVVLADSTDQRGERVLAGFEGKQVRFVHPPWEVGPAQAIRVSPRGGYYALLASDLLGIRVFTRDGRTLGLAIGSPPRAIAWSPNERWTALATRSSVYIYPTERPTQPIVRIPLAARDLDWGE